MIILTEVFVKQFNTNDPLVTTSDLTYTFVRNSKTLNKKKPVLAQKYAYSYLIAIFIEYMCRISISLIYISVHI